MVKLLFLTGICDGRVLESNYLNTSFICEGVRYELGRAFKTKDNEWVAILTPDGRYDYRMWGNSELKKKFEDFYVYCGRCRRWHLIYAPCLPFEVVEQIEIYKYSNYLYFRWDLKDKIKELKNL